MPLIDEEALDKLMEEMFAPDQSKAFVLRNLKPAETATQDAVEALRIELGQRNGQGNKRALCGFLHACQTLHRRDSDLLSYPSSKPVYDADGGGYAAFMSVKRSLIKQDWITLERKAAADHGRSAIYKVLKWPSDTSHLKFEESVQPSAKLLQVKRTKDKLGYGKADGLRMKYPPLNRPLLEQYFGKDRIDHEEARIRHIVDYLSDHPLVMGSTTFRHLKRVFNNESLENGGRLYGSYSPLPKTFRTDASIDGQPIVQIDIKASYLSIRAGLAGQSFEEGKDPYRLIPWVDPANPRTRDMAKQLVAMLIMSGGDKPRFPPGWKQEYSDLIKPRQTITDFKGPVHETFPFLLEYLDGMEVMYHESELMMDVLNTCIDQDLPAWPLHDCIFVREADASKAVEIVKSSFANRFGYRVTVDAERNDGKKITI